MIDGAVLRTLSKHGFVEREIVELDEGGKTILYNGRRPAEYAEVLTIDLFEDIIERAAKTVLMQRNVRDGWVARVSVADENGQEHQGEAFDVDYHRAVIMAAAKAMR